ncbi:MAG: T9SS type A sorting domain-containing protein [Lewinellaceae bacterium]|nr:T9SS type A sorting domain-containing protein [Lewinellaceae bacterium]
MLYGDVQRPNYYNDSFVRRVDKQGNTVWFNYYGDYDVEDGFNDLKPINDSVFAACALVQFGPQTGSSKIVYLDLEGNVLRQWQSEENPEIGFLRNVIPTEDGGLITYGIYLKEIIFSTLIMQPTLAKLDSNFQVQWVKHFGRAASLNAGINLRDFAPTSDGNYIAAGETVIEEGSSDPRRVGWLYKFSPQGDSIWSKHIDTPLGAEYPIGGYFGGVGELSSGSIVAGGAAYEGNEFYPWLVKVDANGCLEAPCPVLNSIAGPMAEGEDIRLFPNPGNGRFRLSWEQAPTGGRALCTLFDAQGRTVWRAEPRAAPEMELDATGLPPGFYMLEVRAAGRRWVGKALIQK